MQPILVLDNPRRRRRKSRKAKARHRRHAAAVVHTNPKRKRRRSRGVMSLARATRRTRRNPIIPSGLLHSQLIPAAQGAAGALALDLALGYLPLPDNLKTGVLRHFVKAGLAIGIGAVVEKVSTRAMGRAAATGALTVVLHDAIREQVVQHAPGVKLGEYVYLTPDERMALGYTGPGQIAGVGMSEFVSGVGNEELNTANLD